MPALLAAALGAGVLAGCSATEPSPTPSPSATPDPDADYLQRAVAAEIALLASYDDPASSVADLSPLVAEARAHHQQHLTALIDSARAAGLPVPTTSSPTPSAVTSGAPAEPRGPQLAPAEDAVDLARRLVAIERRSSEFGRDALPTIRRPVLAVLAAQIAASEGQHATALFTALREGQIRRTSRPSPAPAATRS